MGTKERREREKLERRTQILRCARTLFWERGYDETTMPQIAKALELAPGTLYLYFPSKQTLYMELLLEGYDLLVQRLRAAVREKDAPRRQADALMAAFLRFAREQPDYFRIIFFILQGRGASPDNLKEERELARRLQAYEQECKQIAGEVVARAKPGMSAAVRERRVEAVWAMLTGIVLHFLQDGPETFDKVAGEARELLLQGLLGAA